MRIATVDAPILKRFRAALDETYGDRIERVVLFGSPVHGDAHESLDYDVAVFLKGPGTKVLALRSWHSGAEARRLANAGAPDMLAGRVNIRCPEY
ncbi:MAG: nucleotidyltransferase domain-containing protein [Stellaceae bacterium]